MGTKCIFKVIDTQEEKLVARVYSQYDGYPTGLPRRIFNWMKNGVVGNGIPSSLKEGDVFFNGAGDLAVQLIIRCKMEQCSSITEAGGIYLTNDDDWVDYVYEIFVNGEGHDISVIVYHGGYEIAAGFLSDIVMELEPID